MALLSGCGSSLNPVGVLESQGALPVTGQGEASRSIAVPAGVDVAIELTVHGLDARAELIDPASATTIPADAPNDRAGAIVFHLPAGDARLAELRVLGEDHADNQGQATIKVQALQSRTTADRTRLAALRFEAQGCATSAQGDAAARAAAEFESASHAWLAIGDRVRAGRGLLQAAGARYSQGDQWAQAAQLAQDRIS